MGLFKGTFALRRFRVLERPTLQARLLYDKAIAAHALVPLDPEASLTETRSIGWASAHDEQDIDLTTGKYWQDGRIVLALRIDTLKPPADEVKRLMRKRQRELEAQRKEPLSASALRELREMISLDLRRRTPPKTKAVAMVWDLDEQRVYLASHSKAVCEAFLRLFAETFGIAVDIEGPGYWAQTLCQGPNAELLRKLMPARELIGGFANLRPCVGAAVEATEQPADDTEDQEPSEQASDLEDRRFLGREFLTWLLFAASGEQGMQVDEFSVTVGARVQMKALGEGAGEFTARGVAPAETADVRYCMAGGHTVRACELYFSENDRVSVATVNADGFDLSRVRLPELLSEEDAERMQERLLFIDELDTMLKTAFAKFLDVRLKCWPETLASMTEWLRQSIEK